MKPVSASLPVIWINFSRPSLLRMVSHWEPVRWSFHRMAGRRTAPFLSKSTKPCICPVRPMPLMDEVSTPVFLITWRILSIVACHHSAGSCSLHRGRGVSKRYSFEATPATCPRSSISKALVAVVDVSMPMKYDMLYSNPKFLTIPCTVSSSWGNSMSL